jgi:MFS family permease
VGTSTAAVPLLRDRDFLRYAAARGLSLVGTIGTLVALPVLVYRLTGSAALTAFVAGLEAAPYVVFGLLAGALSDRWDRRRTMVNADLLGAAVVATVPVAYVAGALTVPHVLVVAFLNPTIAVFFDGAAFGAVPTLVGRDRIAQANSYVWTLQNLGEVVTPAVAGVALAVVHPSALLAVDAVTFLGSAALLRSIRRPLQGSREGRAVLSTRQLGRDVAEGLRFLWRHPGVRTMTLVGFTQCVSGGGFVALMVVWCDRQLGIGTEGPRFGIVYASWAVGALVASLTLPRVLRGTSPARVTLLALPVSALLGFLVPVWHRWEAGALSLTAWAVAYTMVVINSISYRQQVTPDRLLGRVNTTGRLLAWGLGWSGGALLAGLLGGWIGLQPALFAVTSVSFVGVVIAYTSPLVRAGRDG